MTNEGADETRKLAFSILKTINAPLSGPKDTDKQVVSVMNSEVSAPLQHELPPLTETMPIRISTRKFNPITSFEHQNFGEPGIRHHLNGALADFEEGLVHSYARNIEPAPIDTRKVEYTSSWEPYRTRDRVAFIAFSPATSADLAESLKLDHSREAARGFLHIESKSVPLKRINELLAQGYPVLSAIRPSDGSLLFVDENTLPLTMGGKQRVQNLPQKISEGYMSEQVDMRRGKVLWTPDALQDEELVRGIARAYHKLRLFKPEVQIYFPNSTAMTPLFTDERKTLISQALMHMMGKHFNWHSNDPRNAAPGEVRLGFSNNRNKIENQDAQIKPDLVESTINVIQQSFGNPWPKALSVWNSLKDKVLK